MKRITAFFAMLTLLSLAMAVPATATLAPRGTTILVTSTADSGPGTLRQAMLDANSGDTISFDPGVFPPSTPVTITLSSELPHIGQGNLTIDGSNSWVVLDGSTATGDWEGCLQIVGSDANTIRGLRVANFPGPGIAISGNARNNVIGGDRSIGAGPFGQGNFLTSNDVGIGLWTDDTRRNTVTGNLIGTDAAGTEGLGNRTGIWITEGARRNTIGPDNLVAHNDGPGIEVDDAVTLGNTITQNSIHDNGLQGIRLWEGGNGNLGAPVFRDYDLQAGSVTGATCANCAVEIFSDSAEEGAIYEGGTTADSTGYFAYQKGAAFVGPHLTATTTDVAGNTSQFSLPATGTAGSRSLQQGNDLPLDKFQSKQSKDLVDNRIGAGFDSFATPEFFDLGLYPRGVKRARMAITGLEPELVDWDRPEFSIDPSHDAVFTRLADNGLTLTYVLMFWDKETWPGGEGAPCARFKTEGEIERYLDFVEFIVGHFKDRVEYFEIWNEPDIREYCPKWIEAADYVNLVKRTVPVIRQEYPAAKIVVGSVSNTRFPDAYDYLFDILESEIMPLVDVVAWHPMYGTSPAYDLYKDYYYQYPSFVQQIKDVASAHGFDGEYQADELGWATPEIAVPDQPWVYTPIVAEKYYGRGILMHLGMDVGVGAPDDNGVVRNLCTVMAGAEPVTLPMPMQIQTTITNTRSYTFTMPSGDRLLALWADGVAVDDDPGITVTLTLPGFWDQKVTGIDVLHGFEQPIIASAEGGALLVEDLLVRDYPLILRLIPTRPVYLPMILKGYPP
jgi:hypothetical protein